MKNKILSGLLAFFIAILIITFSIGLPIYFRPFYYAQIDILDIEAYSGADYETIKEAYDELLDYLTVPGKEFSTGDFKYSENGKSHFVDCKVLFDLNAYAFLISLVFGSYAQRFNLYCGQAQRELNDSQKSVMKQIAEYIVQDGAFTIQELNEFEPDLWKAAIVAFGPKILALEMQQLSKFILKVA